MRHLLIGGARSGKSALAETLARKAGLPVVYIATAQAADAEMAQRIAHHRARRPAGWSTVESPRRLAETLAAQAAPGRMVIVDCLTLWLSNLITGGGVDEADFDLAGFEQERRALLDLLPVLPGEIVLVTNEVGFGIVPMGRLARMFMDEAGRLNQEIAARCERVTLVVAGQPLSLKTPAPDR
jgi:adenosylcobinamide kinase/adenosylcobinamide-phosphate guanylyltransferase